MTSLNLLASTTQGGFYKQMAVINRIRAFRRHATEETAPAVTNMTEDTKTGSVVADAIPGEKTSGEDQHAQELPSEEVQQGVKNIEATTLTWTKGTLIAVFIKFVPVLYCRSMALTSRSSLTLSLSQHLVPILRQCFPIFGLLDSGPLCY